MVKSEMVYTLDDMKALISGSGYKGLFIYIVIILACVGISLSSMFIALEDGAKLSETSYSLFQIVVAIGFIVYVLIHRYVIMPKNNLKNIKSKYGENPVCFDFEETYFTVNVENGANSQNISIEYDKLIKAKEVKDYFFLYSDIQHAYVIKKSAFVMGCPEDLSVYLKKQLGKKFIIRL